MDDMDYTHGGDIYSQEVLWDFSVNINPLGMPKTVKEAVLRALDNCSCYPDSRCRALNQEIAAFHHLSENMVLCANGAADLIFQFIFSLRPSHALVFAPSFSVYEQALSAAGCLVYPLYLQEDNGFSIDAESIIDAAKKMEARGKKPEILCLCNPNNPTGAAMPKEEMERLADFAQRHQIFLLVDECFLDFVKEPDKFSLIPRLADFSYLLILKSFTKLYAVPGLRLGYCLTGNSSLLHNMELARQPWNVSVLAQEAGIAALKEEEYRKKTIQVIEDGRIQLEHGLRELGFCVFPSLANYIFFRDEEKRRAGGQLYEQCRQEKLLIRSCANYRGLDGRYYRICIKTAEENQILLSLLERVSGR